MCGCLNSGRSYNSTLKKGKEVTFSTKDCEISYKDLMDLDYLVLSYLIEDRHNEILRKHNRTISKWKSNYKSECVPFTDFLFIKNYMENEFSINKRNE